ncbi:hypothetical protein SEA_IDYN_84 [Gordonia phage IDyn]|uniref:DUF732 domain-containing protein n=1 Tax=Gordonia phage IDyn TaxID=2510506 RepID=A0A411CUC0_9CAUD|nr:membrane protein [Gordonia phage IDyn]QAY17432.1 hypothetical protein SEA_IDYN_84 [Gordonia phage IDyn]
MDLHTLDGRAVGRATLTPGELSAIARDAATHIGATIDARARELIDAQRAAIADRARPSVDPADGGTDGAAPSRRRRWWPWVAGVLLALALIGAIADGDDDAPAPAADVVPIGAPTVSPQPIDVPRTVPADDGSIMVGGVVVDNVFDDGSPLRERFAGVLTAYGVSGTTGRSLDANLSDGVTFCQNLAIGDALAQRHAAVVTGTADRSAAYGIGKQRRAIVTAALSTLCPAL